MDEINFIAEALDAANLKGTFNLKTSSDIAQCLAIVKHKLEDAAKAKEAHEKDLEELHGLKSKVSSELDKKDLLTLKQEPKKNLNTKSN